MKDQALLLSQVIFVLDVQGGEKQHGQHLGK